MGGDNPRIQPSTGLTNDDGTFDIETGPEEGAPVGEYYATFIWMKETKQKPTQKMMTMDPQVPKADMLKGKYSDSKHPSFTNITIKKGPNQLADFKLQ